MRTIISQLSTDLCRCTNIISYTYIHTCIATHTNFVIFLILRACLIMFGNIENIMIYINKRNNLQTFELSQDTMKNKSNNKPALILIKGVTILTTDKRTSAHTYIHTTYTFLFDNKKTEIMEVNFKQFFIQQNSYTYRPIEQN